MARLRSLADRSTAGAAIVAQRTQYPVVAAVVEESAEVCTKR